MREIKFRAWNKNERRFVKPYRDEHTNALVNCLSIRMDGTLIMSVTNNIAGGTQDIIGDAVDEKFIIEQYTGLEDKNGKEIYEGDIVKGTATQREGGFDYFGEVEFITQNNAYGLQVTEPMINGMAGGWSIDKLSTRISLDHITGEVIGNIHENPELMEQSL